MGSKDREALEGISALLATYAGDEPEHIEATIDSLLAQTRSPDEIVIVIDGPIPKPLRKTLATYVDNWEQEGSEIAGVGSSSSIPYIRALQCEENRGTGVARAMGVEHAQYEYIAILDADDLAVPKRFERQAEWLDQHPDIAALGGDIGEFTDNPQNIHTFRQVPRDTEEIVRYARTRSPMNHATVMARRSRILAAGNYPPLRYGQDYVLWGRLLSNGEALANLPAVLTKVRAGPEMHARRGGWEYITIEIALLTRLYKLNVMSLPRLCANLAVRLPIRLLPNRLRGILYNRLLRS